MNKVSESRETQGQERMGLLGNEGEGGWGKGRPKLRCQDYKPKVRFGKFLADGRD